MRGTILANVKEDATSTIAMLRHGKECVCAQDDTLTLFIAFAYTQEYCAGDQISLDHQNAEHVVGAGPGPGDVCVVDEGVGGDHGNGGATWR